MATIKGMSALKKQLQDVQKQTDNIVKSTINEFVDKMIADAKANAPEDLSNLINSIDKENRDNGWTVVFFVGEIYGAFMEFGTGTKVQVPQELSDVATQFKGYKSGSFQEFLNNIRAWCLRHGIDENAAYPIAVSILNKGLEPRPYFYPAYVKYKDQILPAIDKRLTALMK